MRNAGLEPRPTVLLNLFNSRYWGRSVTFQAVSRWLRGEAVPTQDKLLVLSELLRVDPQVLRFGSKVLHEVRERDERWAQGAGYLERETFDAFLKLPPPQRKLIRETILLFEKANAADAVAVARAAKRSKLDAAAAQAELAEDESLVR